MSVTVSQAERIAAVIYRVRVLQAKAHDESKVNRHPKGAPGSTGGRFTEKGGGQHKPKDGRGVHEGKPGEWFTHKDYGQVFVPDGVDLGKALTDYDKKGRKPKQEKTMSSTPSKLDPSSFDNDGGRIKINIGRKEKFEDVARDTWNAQPIEVKRLIDEFRLNVDEKTTTMGYYQGHKNLISLNTDQAKKKENVVNWINHEVQHAMNTRENIPRQLKWGDVNADLSPVNSYTFKHFSNYLDAKSDYEKALKTGDSDKIRDAELYLAGKKEDYAQETYVAIRMKKAGTADYHTFNEDSLKIAEKEFDKIFGETAAHTKTISESKEFGSLQAFTESDHNRHPEGASESQGGRFAEKGEGGAGNEELKRELKKIKMKIWNQREYPQDDEWRADMEELEKRKAEIEGQIGGGESTADDYKGRRPGTRQAESQLPNQLLPSLDKPAPAKHTNMEGFIVPEGFGGVQIDSDYTDQVSTMQNIWNSIPSEQRSFIKKIDLTDGIDGEFGSLENGVLKLNPSAFNSAGFNDSIIRGIIRHELTHSYFANYPEESFNALMNKVGHVGPVTKYSAMFQNNPSYSEHADHFLERVEVLTNLTEQEGYQSWTEPSTDTIRMYPERKDLDPQLTQWGMTDEDIESGKFLEAAQKYHRSIFNMYENENHAEFLAIYHGNEPSYEVDDANYQKYKKAYEEWIADGHDPYANSLLRREDDSDDQGEGGISGDLHAKWKGRAKNNSKESLTAVQRYRLARVIRQLRARTHDESKVNRHPEGAPSSQGGRFAEKGESGGSGQVSDSNDVPQEKVYDILTPSPEEFADKKTGFNLQKGQKIKTGSATDGEIAKIREGWNALPPERKMLIRNVELIKENSVTEAAFSHKGGGSILINTLGIESANTQTVRDLINHELGHSLFGRLSQKLQKIWIKGQKGTKGMNSYVDSFKRGARESKAKIKSRREEIKAFREKLISGEIDRAIKSGDAVTEVKLRTQKRHLKHRGMTLNDLKKDNGYDEYVRRTNSYYYEYENEQFTAFLTQYYNEKRNVPVGQDTIELPDGNLEFRSKYDNPDYLKLKEVYESMDLGPFTRPLTATAKLRILNVVSQLRAAHDESKVNRHPKGSSESKGGRFAKKGEGGGGSSVPKGFETIEGFVLPKGFDIEVDSEYGSAIDSIQNIWNGIPHEHKSLITRIRLDDDYDAIAQQDFGELTINPREISDTGFTDSVIRAIIYHELAHAYFEQMSDEAFDALMKYTRGKAPVTAYSAHFLTQISTNRRHAEKLLSFAQELTDAAQDKKDIQQNPTFIKLWPWISSWEISDDDIKSGKFLEMAKKYHRRSYNLYENENHSEFMSIYQGNDVVYEVNQKNYESYKVAYEKWLADGYGQVKDAKPLSAVTRLRVLNVIHSLRARIFRESDHNRVPSGSSAGGQFGKGSGSGKPAPEFGDIYKQARRIIRRHSDKKAYSWNPKTGNVLTIDNPQKVKKVYQEMLADNPDFDPKKPIYIVGTTNHQGKLGRRIQSEYSSQRLVRNTPMLGFWRNKTGFEYLDVSYPAQFNSEAEASKTGAKYGQESLLILFPDGRSDFT